MKKGVIFGSVIFLFLVLIGMVSAATLTSTDVTSDLATASITNAQNIYGYEITYAYTGSIDGVTSYNFLSLTPGDTSDIGYVTRGGNVSVYESRLDNTLTGVSGNGDLFNISHSGTLTLKSMLLTYNNGVEETTSYNQDGTTTVTVVTVSGGGGGGTTTKVQNYNLKILSPGDVTLPKEGIISVPITIENFGDVSLKGISLGANVTFNNLISSDVSINLGETYIGELKSGEKKDLTITIRANTKKQGIYKVTVYANVDSPKFTDWGEFYIEFKKTNENDVENAISAAEMLFSENTECLELTELLNDARTLLDERDFTKSAAKVQEAVGACEKLILRQSPYQKIFRSESIIYYIGIATAAAVLIGIGFYIYKRIKFGRKRGKE